MVYKQGPTPTYHQFDAILLHKSTTMFSTPRTLEKQANNTRKYLYNSQPSHSVAYIRVSSPWVGYLGWKLPSCDWIIGLCRPYRLGVYYKSSIFNPDVFFQADGYLARRFKMSSVLGTILDPAADKALMTTLTITLTMRELIPGLYSSSFAVILTHQWRSVPLAVIILGRDVLLSLSALYIRYSTLPNPVRHQLFPISQPSPFAQKTFSRYWDFSLPSAEVRPTTISKVYISSLFSHASSHPA